MKKYLMFLLVMFSFQSQGANIWCYGAITNFYVTHNGFLVIRGSWRNDYTNLCNVKDDPVVDPVTCSLWTSIAAASINHNKPVRLMYDDRNGTMTCADIPAYSGAPTPAYLMLSSE